MTNFSGIGTIFTSEITNLANVAKYLGPMDLIKILERYINHVTSIVEKHRGSILQFEGDAILAFWHPEQTNPSHAQLAFNASCEIISKLPRLIIAQKHLTYDIDIVLGTGEMSGDFFGPAKVFQVVGKAMSIVDRLNKIPYRKGSIIRMTQYTLDMLDKKNEMSKLGIIKRDSLDDLIVYGYGGC